METSNQPHELRTIDLFCGAGGSSYGAKKAGAKIVAGFDIWPSAIKTYAENFSEATTFEGDLRKFSPEAIKEKIGDIDLILASPECTNHSVAKGARERSEESKMTAFQVTRYAKVFRPKWIVLENVVEMGSWNKHPDLLKELWDLKYFVNEVELNAADFGVPQSRNRLFLLCSLTSENKLPDVKPTKHVPVSSIIDWSDKYPYTPLYQKGRAYRTLKRARNAIKVLGEKEPFLMVYYGTGDGWQSIDKPLRTITTLDRFALVLPKERGHKMRMLQPEELKLAMGYGIDFSIEQSLTRREKIKLMGNGVCPPVMASIVGRLCVA